MRALKVCSTPTCPELVPTGRCTECTRKAEQQRGSAAARGYDPRWARRRAAYLVRHPFCCIDGAVATVADHYPLSRRELVAQGVRDPDADHRLRPLCASCHSKQTAEHQPGGWNIR
jgi:5-methylcytosine-specific restriction protein A